MRTEKNAAWKESEIVVDPIYSNLTHRIKRLNSGNIIGKKSQ